MYIRILASLFACLYMCVSNAGSIERKRDCQSIKNSVHVKAQPMAAALKTLAEQVDCPVSLDTELGQLKSNSIKGEMSPLTALLEISKGTGLEVSLLPDGLSVGRHDQEKLKHRVEVIKTRIIDQMDAGQITRSNGKAQIVRLNKIVQESEALAKTQGFISAAEMASYDRELVRLSATLKDLSQ